MTGGVYSPRLIVPLFYRLTHSDHPVVDDFKSHAELLGMQKRPKSVSQREWEGVSVRPSLDNARMFYSGLTDQLKAKLGHFVTELNVPDGLEVVQTGPDPNHYSIWAPAVELHGYITTTVPAVP